MEASQRTVACSKRDEEPLLQNRSEMAGERKSFQSEQLRSGSFRTELERIESTAGIRERTATLSDFDPAEAIANLLGHVRFDKDGGILNLETEKEKLDREQLSKVHALVKNPVEQILALIAIIRSVMNPVLILFFQVQFLSKVFFDPTFKDWLVTELEKIRFVSPMTVVWIAAVIASVETAIIIFVILRTVWQGLHGLCDSQSAGSATPNLQPKYFFLAQFFFKDLRFLQGFSMLRIFTYIHPNLIMKRLHAYNKPIDAASRSILEMFLKRKPNELCETEIVEQVAHVIVAVSHKKEDAENRKALAADILRCSSYDVLKRLRKSQPHLPPDAMTKLEVDPKALTNFWRVEIFRWTLNSVVLLGTILVFCVFALTLLVKICRICLVLTDPNGSLYSTLLALALFYNSVMSIVDVNTILFDRVERFVFGGSDARVSSEEQYLMDFYLALLCERVLNLKDMRFFKKMIILIQLDDDDLQQLIVEENRDRQAKVTKEIRNYMAHALKNISLGDRFVAMFCTASDGVSEPNAPAKD